MVCTIEYTGSFRGEGFLASFLRDLIAYQLPKLVFYFFRPIAGHLLHMLRFEVSLQGKSLFYHRDHFDSLNSSITHGYRGWARDGRNLQPKDQSNGCQLQLASCGQSAGEARGEPSRLLSDCGASESC